MATESSGKRFFSPVSIFLVLIVTFVLLTSESSNKSRAALAYSFCERIAGNLDEFMISTLGLEDNVET